MENTLIGGVLITQHQKTCMDLSAQIDFDFGNHLSRLNEPSVDPFGVDPIFSRSSSVFGGVDLENNIGKYYNVSELPVSGVPNGFSVRSTDLENGRTGFSVFIDMMSSNKQANRIISYMREGNFIDTSTKSIVVKFATFNPLTVRFTNTQVQFEYSKGGSVEVKAIRASLSWTFTWNGGLLSSCLDFHGVLDYSPADSLADSKILAAWKILQSCGLCPMKVISTSFKNY